MLNEFSLHQRSWGQRLVWAVFAVVLALACVGAWSLMPGRSVASPAAGDLVIRRAAGGWVEVWKGGRLLAEYRAGQTPVPAFYDEVERLLAVPPGKDY